MENIKMEKNMNNEMNTEFTLGYMGTSVSYIKLVATFLEGPHNKDYNILKSRLGSPLLREATIS